MRLRSLLAVLILGLSTLGLVGCDSTGSSDESFVRATQPVVNTTTGNVTFNFVQAQFAVGATANQLRIEFFANTTQTGTPLGVNLVAFQPTVTIANVPVTAQSFRVTSLDANRIPLVTIVQNITVTPGITNVVATIATPQPVLLNQLVLVDPASSTTFPPSIANPLTQLNLQTGATGQIYLVANYNSGDNVVLGNLANYVTDPNNANAGNIFSVNGFGTITALAPGTANVVITFGGQTLQIPIEVSAALNVNFTTLASVNQTIPLVPTPTQPATVFVVGTVAGSTQTFGPAPNSQFLTYSVTGGAGISVTNSGVVNVAAGTVAGTTATVTVTYTNANATTVTTTVAVTSG